MDFPLSGVRVLEIPGGVASGFAAKQLAGYGADVVVAEGLSDLPPLSEDETTYLTAGKRRVDATAVDLRALALAADVVVEEGTPGRLDVAAWRAAKPALVVTSISPFGQTGPYAQYPSTNAVSFALGGIMSLTGDYFRPPLVSGGSQAQYYGGLHAFGATATAYLGAVLSGEGDWIDVSLQECAAGTTELYGPMTSYIGGDGLPRMGNQTRAEWGIYPCLDGYAGLFALQRQVPALFAAMDDPELVTGEWFDPVYRTQHAEELVAKMYVFTTGKTKDELLAIGRDQKVPIGVALTPADLLERPSLDARGFWDDVDGVRLPGRALDGLAWRAPDRLHAPGEDTELVSKEWLQ
ncbi:MAG TPA: CoA transferase [Acidimicrobiales bacterium]|nr:CoA transferase [Acidimicrobiales bacterium]